MKKTLLVLALLGFQTASADTFTNDWYTTCQEPTAEAKASHREVRLGDKSYKLNLIMPDSGTSVFLGKDVRLAEFIITEILGVQCWSYPRLNGRV